MVDAFTVAVVAARNSALVNAVAGIQENSGIKILQGSVFGAALFTFYF
ncbi:MAG: hypothetical protein Q8N28_02495 [bacterium]|nr:hypothetical protein [bacterium]